MRSNSNRVNVESFEIVNITSLQDFHFYDPQLSWNGELAINRNFVDINQYSIFLKVGGGFSHQFKQNIFFYNFFNIAGGSDKNGNTRVYPQLNTALGKRLKGSAYFLETNLSAEGKNKTSLMVKYFLNEDKAIYISITEENNYIITVGTKIHF